MNKKKFIEEVSNENEGERIDKWISSNLPDFSRNYIQKLIDGNDVSVNGNVISKSSYKIKENDIVELLVPESMTPNIEPVNIPLDILFEDDDIIIINKPKGMVVHPAPGHMNDTLVNALLYHCGDSLSGINGIMRPGIVHRIDRDTTGSLIICKNDKAHQSIASQLAVHSINREYRTIVCGTVKEQEGTVSGFIGRDKNDRKKMAVTDSLHGKKAITHYTVLEQFKNFAYVSCKLETGRTHQIRVHMNSIHNPVLGDEVYGHNLGLKEPMKLTGQCLHAYIIGFIHPSTNEYVEFCAPIPDYFNKLLDMFRSII